MSPCSLDAEEIELAFRTWLCRGCNGPKQGCGAIDVRLQSPLRLDKPLTFVAGGFPGIALKELLWQIDPEIVQRDLKLGRVFRSDGKLLDDWATFHGRYTLIIRGTESISQRVCSDCGRLVYFAMGERYLFPEPPTDADVYESDLSGLILKQREFQRLDLTRWRRGVHVDRVRVGDQIVEKKD